MSGHSTGAAGTAAFAGAAGTNSGGAGATSLSGTGGAQGLAGTGGAAGAAQNSALTGACSDSDLPPSPTDYSTPLQYAKQGTATGDNGTFNDHCDADGMLVEYMCAQSLGCSAPPGGDCAPRNHPTGQVINQRLDCKGWCMDGACRVPCPKVNDQLTVDLHTNIQLYQLAAKGGPSYLCARDSACPLLQGGPQVLTVTSAPGGSMPTESCLMLFGNDPAPFQLSDGCKYFACMAEPKAGP
jgi:hypothetical protein